MFTVSGATGQERAVGKAPIQFVAPLHHVGGLNEHATLAELGQICLIDGRAVGELFAFKSRLSVRGSFVLRR